MTSQRRLYTALLLPLLILCCSSSNQSFNLAEKALENKNWDAAVYEYNQALLKDPDNPEIKVKLRMVKTLPLDLTMKTPKNCSNKTTWPKR